MAHRRDEQLGGPVADDDVHADTPPERIPERLARGRRIASDVLQGAHAGLPHPWRRTPGMQVRGHVEDAGPQGPAVPAVRAGRTQWQ
jgi:hypothetical protein